MRFPIYCLNASKLLPLRLPSVLKCQLAVCVCVCMCPGLLWPSIKGCTWDVQDTIGKGEETFFTSHRHSQILCWWSGSIIFQRADIYGFFKTKSLDQYFNNVTFIWLSKFPKDFIYATYLFLSFLGSHRIPLDNQHSTHSPVPVEREQCQSQAVSGILLLPPTGQSYHQTEILHWSSPHLCHLTTSLVPHGHTDWRAQIVWCGIPYGDPHCVQSIKTKEDKINIILLKCNNVKHRKASIKSRNVSRDIQSVQKENMKIPVIYTRYAVADSWLWIYETVKGKFCHCQY